MHIRLAGCGLPLLRLYHARWQGSWVLTGRAVTRFRFSRALAGITRAGRDRVRLLDSDLVNHSLFRAGWEHVILIHVRIAIGHLVPRGQ